MTVADAIHSLPERSGFDVWGFLLFSHGWTWAWWSVPVVAGWQAFGFPGVVFFVAGGLGVPIGGIAMTWLVDGRAGLREYRNRLVAVARIPRRWLLVVVGCWPALAFAGVLVAAIFGTQSPVLSFGELREALVAPVEFVASLLVLLVVGPLPEELGWRGYWLDHLQSRWSALTASVVLGVAWAAWHAPLFLMVGYFSSFDYAPQPASYAFNILLASVLYTWLHNNTRRSILAVVAFHFVQNATGQYLSLSPAAARAQTAVTLVATLAIIAYWGPHDLRR